MIPKLLLLAVVTSSSAMAASVPHFRRVRHTEAYKPRPQLGPYVSIKVTPPEKRGRKHRVLVEVYNYSKAYVSEAAFDLTLRNGRGVKIEARITAENLKPNFSALRWVQIPGTGEIPAIDSVDISNMNLLDADAHRLKLPYYIDLIKE